MPGRAPESGLSSCSDSIPVCHRKSPVNRRYPAAARTSSTDILWKIEGGPLANPFTIPAGHACGHRIHEQDAAFRMKSNANAMVTAFNAANDKHRVVDVKPTYDALKSLRQQYPGATFGPVKLRLLKYKAGKTKFVIGTSLVDEKTFSTDDFAGLYHKRWQVEEFKWHWSKGANLPYIVLARKPRNMLIIREDMSICTYEDSWNLLRLGQIRSHNGGFRQIFESGKYCEIHLRRSFLRHASYGGSRTRPQLPG